MFRNVRQWIFLAIPVVGFLAAPLASDAGDRRVRSNRYAERYYRNGYYRNAYNAATPPYYNSDRLYYQVPGINPVPQYGYYGASQYYSMWVPSGYYNFR